MDESPACAPDTKKPHIFFENLNGVRAAAAFLVVISHIEFHKPDFGLHRINGVNLFKLGKVGVIVFFTLSGFLITYLLLAEKANFNKVSIKDFYVRRMLRIWPLYFLLIVIGFFIYPKIDASAALWMSVFFVPNVAFSLNLLPVLVDPIWSIGIEEQFYIFLPHFLRIKKLENLLYTLLAMLVLYFAAFTFTRHFQYIPGHETAFNRYFFYAMYGDMIVGAMIAVLYFNTKNRVFAFKFQKQFNAMFSKPAQWFYYLLLFGFSWVYITYILPQGDILIALLSGLIIVNLCEPASSILSLNYPKLQFLGRISYGIYLFHKFPIFAALYLSQRYLKVQSTTVQNLFIYTATLLVVIALATCSYYGYERYFLNLKKRFQKIRNNDGNGTEVENSNPKAKTLQEPALINYV